MNAKVFIDTNVFLYAIGRTLDDAMVAIERDKPGSEFECV
jgi:predicted nucleic acid-binding protein